MNLIRGAIIAVVVFGAASGAVSCASDREGANRAAASGGAATTGGERASVEAGSNSGGAVDVPDGPALGPCAAADVRQVDPPNCGPTEPAYHWTGNQCRLIDCCEGAGCGPSTGYPTLDACDRAHTACYEAAGVSQLCTQDDDCALTKRSCCHCGLQTATRMIAVHKDSAAAYRSSVCSTDECGPCASIENEFLLARCNEGVCMVLEMALP